MVTVQIILLKIKKLKDNKHPVVLRLNIDGKRKYYFLGEKKGFACTIDQWDFEKNRFNKNDPDNKLKNPVLDNKLHEAKKIIIKADDEKKTVTFQSFEQAFFNPQKNETVQSFFETEIKRLKSIGSINYSNIYKYTKNRIFAFTKNKDLKFTDIDYKFLKNFENFLISNKDKPNTIHVYLRTLRTLYNSAIKNNICKEKDYPFKAPRSNPNGYSFESFKSETRKRALTKKQMKSICKFSTKPGTKLFDAKNFFLFSFYTRGMNFKDIAYLKWTDIVNGRIEYIRAKTGGQFSIQINPDIENILNIYKKNNKSEYVFPIINPEFTDNIQIFNRIKKVLSQTNKHLKFISEKLKIDFNITFYCARHSWATIMKFSGQSMTVIKDGLGHHTEEQTATYLKSFPNEVLDKANRNLLK